MFATWFLIVWMEELSCAKFLTGVVLDVWPRMGTICMYVPTAKFLFFAENPAFDSYDHVVCVYHIS